MTFKHQGKTSLERWKSLVNVIMHHYFRNISELVYNHRYIICNNEYRATLRLYDSDYCSDYGHFLYHRKSPFFYIRNLNIK